MALLIDLATGEFRIFYRFTDIINISEPEMIALPSIQESILPAAGMDDHYDVSPLPLTSEKPPPAP